MLITTLALITLSSSRLHFSNERFPTIAHLQGNHRLSEGGDDRRPEIIGHRGSGLTSIGASRLIGNTSNAIRRAVDANVDWIEIDVRLSRDGHLVAFHDEAIDEKTTGRGRVSELTLEQLRSVDVLVEPREKILSLDEVFDRFHAERRQWVLDLKAGGMRSKLVPWIRQRLHEDQVVLIGVEEILREYEGSEYALGYVAPWGDVRQRLRALLAPSEIIERSLDLGCAYLVLPIIFTDQRLVDEANAHQLTVWAYGTNDPTDLAHASRRGIAGLIVDRPHEARRLFPRQTETRPAADDP